MARSSLPHLACIIEKLHKWTDDVIQGDSDGPGSHPPRRICSILKQAREMMGEAKGCS